MHILFWLKSSKTKDADYLLRDKEILNLIKKLVIEVTLLASIQVIIAIYQKVIENESSNLIKVLESLGVNQNFLKSDTIKVQASTRIGTWLKMEW